MPPLRRVFRSRRQQTAGAETPDEDGGGAGDEAGGEVREETTMTWADHDEGDGGAEAFLTNHNRRMVDDTLRMAAIVKA